MPNPLFLWSAMRAAAIARHRWFNLVFEGGCPLRWEDHMRVIRAFYGV